MGSMLGLVLSDNVIALFVFWELTGFTSYLLIGFEHERPEARRAATQALLVTGGGGLALLAAGLLLLDAAGTALLSELAGGGRSRHIPLYVGDRCAGAARGVHEVRAVPVPLLAAQRHAGADAGQRLPALGDDGEGGHLPRRADDTARSAAPTLWTGTITVVGGAHHDRRSAPRAVRDRPQARARLLDDQRARHPDAAVRRSARRRRSTAGFAYLLAHACYKGALFLVAGAVEHETGTRDVARARRTAPRDAADRASARRSPPASMAGIPLLRRLHRQGAVLRQRQAGALPGSGAASSSRWPSRRACALAPPGSSPASLRFAVAPYRHPAAHDAPPSLWLGPLSWACWASSSAFCRRWQHGPIALASEVGDRDPIDGPLGSVARLHRRPCC